MSREPKPCPHCGKPGAYEDALRREMVDALIDQIARIASISQREEKLRIAGAPMANLCHNWAQNSERFTEHERATLKDMQVAWDDAVESARSAGE